MQNISYFNNWRVWVSISKLHTCIYFQKYDEAIQVNFLSYTGEMRFISLIQYLTFSCLGYNSSWTILLFFVKPARWRCLFKHSSWFVVVHWSARLILSKSLFDIGCVNRDKLRLFAPNWWSSCGTGQRSRISCSRHFSARANWSFSSYSIPSIVSY
jgi:hypothetical protein